MVSHYRAENWQPIQEALVHLAEELLPEQDLLLSAALLLALSAVSWQHQISCGLIRSICHIQVAVML